MAVVKKAKRSSNRAPQQAAPFSPYCLHFVQDDVPSWLHDLAQEAAQAGYETRFVTLKTLVTNPQNFNATDILLLTQPDHCHAIAALMPQRPHTIYLAAFDSDLTTISAADLIVPASFSFLHHNLRSVGWAHPVSLTTIAELEQIKSQLSEQQRLNDELTLLKNAIVRNVSHELKTPLLHVKSAVSMLVEDHQNDTLSVYATEAVSRLEAIIKNISLLATSLDIQPSAALVREMLDHAMRNLRRSWSRKEDVNRVQIVLEDNLPPVFVDKMAIAIVMQLLIDNALKFSKVPIEIHVNQVSEGISVIIRDYGIGIPPEELSKIFDSFYQVDSSSTRHFGGTGVGLAIVRLILERHHIRIEVESTPEEGSTFRFILPLQSGFTGKII